MGITEIEVVNALSASIRQLQRDMDSHCQLVTSYMGNSVSERNLRPMHGLMLSFNRESKLKSAISEAIDVIEESRKAFKSKKLETLRIKLTRVLIDTN